jgi:hypothetical protein
MRARFSLGSGQPAVMPSIGDIQRRLSARDQLFFNSTKYSISYSQR